MRSRTNFQKDDLTSLGKVHSELTHPFLSASNVYDKRGTLRQGCAACKKTISESCIKVTLRMPKCTVESS